jgi:hypothetical protein
LDDETFRAIRRFRIAESDMRQAAAAARFLDKRGREMHGDAERALETGMVVCYARPFTRNKIGAIPRKLARPGDAAQSALHDALVKRRNDLYAHNERLRVVMDTSERATSYTGIGNLR